MGEGVVRWVGDGFDKMGGGFECSMDGIGWFDEWMDEIKCLDGWMNPFLVKGSLVCTWWHWSWIVDRLVNG